jgi:cellulose synthase/poly-beta-1,6-N-acetylglucosamine synthase-like glycosyltransferase
MQLWRRARCEKTTESFSLDHSKEKYITLIGLAVCASAFTITALDFARVATQGNADIDRIAELAIFAVITILLLYGNIVHQVARLGHIGRQARHVAAPREEIERIYDLPAPRIAILIPSYREEENVLKQTVFAASLAEYPNRSVTVLIDDTPNDLAALAIARRVVADIGRTFALQAERLQMELRHYLSRSKAGAIDRAMEARRLSQLYQGLAEWLEARAEEFRATTTPNFAHTDQLFIERILHAPAHMHRQRAATLCLATSDLLIEREYRRLAALMQVEISSFERKQFVNLSHEPNKAMNLNSYIGLIGRSLHEVDGRLEDCAPRIATLAVPAADYVLTLDADSLILSDYALRLIDIMERNPRIAVAQTPYSAIAGPARVLERIAGATTDIQYIVHQGFTRFGATYWVGANALLRVAALREIRRDAVERGHVVPVFIQDRTVIEDTGSTIDLVRRGWTLHNYPERLAYSATPPDYGSLIIQRRRWSNGGLIIMSNLVGYCFGKSDTRPGLAEIMLRAYYLCSPAFSNVGLLILLLYPFHVSIVSPWLALTAAPYYFLYGRDLRQAGYGWGDLLRVYALNLLLLPVNLAGVLQSLRQLITGQKTPFGRTPKIEDRTATPPLYIFFQWAIVSYLAVNSVLDIEAREYTHAAFAMLNVAFYFYGLTVFIGWRAAFADIRLALSERLAAKHRPLPDKSEPARAPSYGQPADFLAASARSRLYARAAVPEARAAVPLDFGDETPRSRAELTG